jgi:hypothetical protein
MAAYLRHMRLCILVTLHELTARISPNIYISPRAAVIALSSTDSPFGAASPLSATGGVVRHPAAVSSDAIMGRASRYGILCDTALAMAGQLTFVAASCPQLWAQRPNMASVCRGYQPTVDPGQADPTIRCTAPNRDR